MVSTTSAVSARSAAISMSARSNPNKTGALLTQIKRRHALHARLVLHRTRDFGRSPV